MWIERLLDIVNTWAPSRFQIPFKSSYWHFLQAVCWQQVYLKGLEWLKKCIQVINLDSFKEVRLPGRPQWCYYKESLVLFKCNFRQLLILIFYARAGVFYVSIYRPWCDESAFCETLSRPCRKPASFGNESFRRLPARPCQHTSSQKPLNRRDLYYCE